MPPEPSVTSAWEPLCECTLRYSSALLPKSFARPGPKSVSPAMYCSAVKIVVWCKWIVDIHLLSLSGDELLSAVDVVGCAREGGIGHNVYGERSHVCRSDHASDGKRGAKLVATFFELITQHESVHFAYGPLRLPCSSSWCDSRASNVLEPMLRIQTLVTVDRKKTPSSHVRRIRAKRRRYCLSKTTSLLTSRPCASLPFHVEVRVFPSFETTEVIVISTSPPFFSWLSIPPPLSRF